jgi:hypothetical protein
VELEGRETIERSVPESLEEAYELCDASTTPEEQGFYQEHVYRLRAKEYRSRGIRIEESVWRREWSRAETLRAREDTRRSWWERVLGRWK